MLNKTIFMATLAALSCMLGLIIIWGSSQKNAPLASTTKLNIVCTTSMITDAVRIIGGDHVNVKGLMGPGVDPHLYKAREGDMHALASADIIFYNGLHLEGKMSDVFKKMHARTTTVALADAIPRDQLRTASFQGLYDPHIWFDVRLWIQVVQLIGQTVIALDSAHQADYELHLKAYLAQLTELDQYITMQAQRIPSAQRILVTAHDAFGYFGKAYGFDVIGLQGLSTDSEAGTQDIQNLASFIAKNRIRAIFVESSIPPRSLRAVQNAARATGWSVDIGPELFSDALGSPDSLAGSYIGMMRHNIDVLVGSLS
jgi:manganese/zinc/iron transport system substrate-binding protein